MAGLTITNSQLMLLREILREGMALDDKGRASCVRALDYLHVLVKHQADAQERALDYLGDRQAGATDSRPIVKLPTVGDIYTYDGYGGNTKEDWEVQEVELKVKMSNGAGALRFLSAASFDNVRWIWKSARRLPSSEKTTQSFSKPTTEPEVVKPSPVVKVFLKPAS